MWGQNNGRIIALRVVAVGLYFFGFVNLHSSADMVFAILMFSVIWYTWIRGESSASRLTKAGLTGLAILGYRYLLLAPLPASASSVMLTVASQLRYLAAILAIIGPFGSILSAVRIFPRISQLWPKIWLILVLLLGGFELLALIQVLFYRTAGA